MRYLIAGYSRPHAPALFISFSMMLAASFTAAQTLPGQDDESRLYAQSKQVNQFFRRFNGEEDEKGNRYYAKDKQYHSAKLRKKYLGIIFDDSNTGMSRALKTEFANYILDNPEQTILDFHAPGWFSEVQTTFLYNGKEQPVTLFMELEKDHLGSKWVIQHVYSDIFAASFVRDTTKVGRFLHPMSHELDFMNLRKAFANTDSIAQFTVKRFTPDHLSVFLYEVKRGNLKFKAVDRVKFHFFQLNGWYFELADYNRAGYNTGWLISNIVKIKSDEDKNALKKYLYESR